MAGRRIRLQVAADDTPSLVFLDADGKTVEQLGPTPPTPLPGR
jgi:hypothetical protein